MTKKNNTRPEIASIAKGSELRRWYWLKTELATEARRLGVKCTGAKFDILERLCHFHDTGELKWPGDEKESITSTFDWHSAELTIDTVITDNYKNTQNVRRFFQTHVDPSFKFNIALIDWFRGNVGKTLGDAGIYWQTQRANQAQTKIKPHNQFNQYIRDFMADNPSLTSKDAKKYWSLKKALPSDTGRHFYERSDLEIKNLTTN